MQVSFFPVLFSSRHYLLWGPYPIKVIMNLGHIHPSMLFRRRYSLVADDVVVAVLAVVFWL